jgi:predicted metal-dependent peptidase
VTAHSARAARALAHLGEVDPALAVLALWCNHRDGAGQTITQGATITYGPAFDTLALPEQVGIVAHHVLHVALRHSARATGLTQRLGPAFDPDLFGIAADGIVNETLILAGHAVPRPAVTLTDLLAAAGLAATSPLGALEHWDADRLTMALHSDEGRAKRVAEWGQARGFARDLSPDDKGSTGNEADTAEWRNRMLQALEAGRKAGSGIGRLGAVLADLAHDSVAWEVHLRGLLARAVMDKPHPNWHRPAGRWIARMAHSDQAGGPVPIYEPGTSRIQHRPRIVIGLDTSASIMPLTLRLLATEAEAIARRSAAEVHLLAFDTTVHTTKRLDPTGWQTLRDMECRIGGGTDFRDLFDSASRVHPSVLIVLTDLEAPIPTAPQMPVIWAVPKLTTLPPYGKIVQIDTAVC